MIRPPELPLSDAKESAIDRRPRPASCHILGGMLASFPEPHEPDRSGSRPASASAAVIAPRVNGLYARLAEHHRQRDWSRCYFLANTLTEDAIRITPSIAFRTPDGASAESNPPPMPPAIAPKPMGRISRTTIARSLRAPAR